MQPVWPLQCSLSSAASFSGNNGSPPFSNIASTKSRLLTRLPGTKKRTSILFSLVNPDIAGQTSGRIKSDTKHSAGTACVEVNGNFSNSVGGLSATASSRAKVSFGTASLSSGIGRPPSVT